MLWKKITGQVTNKNQTVCTQVLVAEYFIHFGTAVPFDGPGNGAILVVDVSIRRQYLIRGYAVHRTWQKIISHHWLLTVTWMIEEAVKRSVLRGS